MNQEQHIEIVRLQPDDWKILRQLRVKSLQNEPTAFGQSYDQVNNFPEVRWQELLKNPLCEFYAVKVGDSYVGLGGVRFEEPAYVQHIAKIIWIYIDPDYRGKGLAKRLMDYLLDILRKNSKTSKVCLSVNATQSAAISLYKKLGFVPGGLAQKEIKIGMDYYDQIHMELFFEEKL